MTKWANANNSTARTVWYVQEMTSLYCKGTSKTLMSYHDMPYDI